MYVKQLRKHTWQCSHDPFCIIWTVLSIRHLNLSCIRGLSDDLQRIVHAVQSKRKADNTVCSHSVGTNYCLVLNLNFQTAIMQVPLIKHQPSHCFQSLQNVQYWRSTITKFLSLQAFLSPWRIHSPSLTIPLSHSATLPCLLSKCFFESRLLFGIHLIFFEV